ncbi:hypothetical protein HMPREF3224_02158, partial [Anaerococcus hydrogenalis]
FLRRRTPMNAKIAKEGCRDVSKSGKVVKKTVKMSLQRMYSQKNREKFIRNVVVIKF